MENKGTLEELCRAIYQYDDYRLFLKDYFEIRKALSRQFSQRYFAQKAGFNNHSLCNLVINGKRNITSESLPKFIKAMELPVSAANYFEILVQFNQESDQKTKLIYFNKLQNLKSQSEFYSLDANHENFYSKWYFHVLRDVAVQADWRGNYPRLASLVFPAILPKEAKDAVKFMLEAGILIKTESGYDYANEHINDSNVPVHMKKQIRRETFLTGVDALDTVVADKRFAAYTTFTTDRKTYEEITELYESFKQKAFEKIIESQNADEIEVFQMTYNLFPASKPIKKRKS